MLAQVRGRSIVLDPTLLCCITFSRTFICNGSWSIFFRVLSGSRRLDSTALTPLVQVFALAMCLFFSAMMWLALATEGKRIGGLQIPQPKGFR